MPLSQEMCQSSQRVRMVSKLHSLFNLDLYTIFRSHSHWYVCQRHLQPNSSLLMLGTKYNFIMLNEYMHHYSHLCLRAGKEFKLPHHLHYCHFQLQDGQSHSNTSPGSNSKRHVSQRLNISSHRWSKSVIEMFVLTFLFGKYCFH